MKLKYDEWTPASAPANLPPIILLHSFLETRRTWKNIGPQLAKNTGRVVFALDARRHGESERRGEYTLDAMADDVVQFLREHSVASAVLLGHSAGGKVAITVALRHPEKVAKLIVEDSTPRDFKLQGGSLVPFAMAKLQESLDSCPEGCTKEEAQHFFRDCLLLLVSELRTRREMLEKYDFDLLPVVWKDGEYVLDFDLDAVADLLGSQRLQQRLRGQYHGPTLFVLGLKSQFKIHKDPMVEEFFPAVKKVEFKDAGHFIHQDYPDEFVKEVTNFINANTIPKAKF